MLKALELAGFKSFADRTRFDFPDGITVIVGPNGSGKSNVVDAIKWVLGSQSAKALRGKEMSDVIFKGAQGRGPAGTAEATIVFDNSSGTLPVDSPEVRVTRRVFRSGEGEYLINNQPCRLKDVKDLIRGTGIGIDAYSLIEQGKVDRMLQANAKDRRAIFEEAAGISRFKAKKVEAERRLGRVQQNLVRLGDIVDEVATRLQSLKTQASKAERYRQATEQLRQLRTQLAWNDWDVLCDELAAAESDWTQAQQTLAQCEQRRDELAAERQLIDGKLQAIAEQARTAEAQQAEVGRLVATFTGQRQADTAAVQDLAAAMQKSLRRLRLLQSQSGSAAAELRNASERLKLYQSELQNAREKVAEVEQQRTQCEAAVAAAAARRDDLQREQLTTQRGIADLEGNLQRADQQLAESRPRWSNSLNAKQRHEKNSLRAKWKLPPAVRIWINFTPRSVNWAKRSNWLGRRSTNSAAPSPAAAMSSPRSKSGCRAYRNASMCWRTSSGDKKVFPAGFVRCSNCSAAAVATGRWAMCWGSSPICSKATSMPRR